jgi:hypothetical protein
MAGSLFLFDNGRFAGRLRRVSEVVVDEFRGSDMRQPLSMPQTVLLLLNGIGNQNGDYAIRGFVGHEHLDAGAFLQFSDTIPEDAWFWKYDKTGIVHGLS